VIPDSGQCTVEQHEDGAWFAHARLGSGGGANGNGDTPEEAVADLREAVQMVLEEDGVPPASAMPFMPWR
jgi:predicted RNase H-like HicB family nuclease